MATRGSYVHKPMVKLFGGVLWNFLQILIFQTKQFTGLLELMQLYKQTH